MRAAHGAETADMSASPIQGESCTSIDSSEAGCNQMSLTFETFSLGKLRQTLSQLSSTLLDVHGHIRDIGKKIEVLDLVVLLDQPLHILIVLS